MTLQELWFGRAIRLSQVKLLENEVTLGEVKFVDMEQDLIAGFRKEQSRKKVEFEVRVFYDLQCK